MSTPSDLSAGTLPAELDFFRDRDASPARMDRAMQYLWAAIRAAGARLPELEALADDLQANGLTRIAEALGPVYQDAIALAAQLEQLHQQYLGEGVVPAILAQAATAAAAQLTTYVAQHDQAFAAYAAGAAETFAPMAHHHVIADIDGLQLALDSRQSSRSELFATSGTWTKPSGLVAAIVVCIGGGGGGGGGGAISGGGAYFSGGCGGGGGGFSIATILAAGLGATEPVTVGAGGGGGISESSGAAGGTTSFGTRVAAQGGGGGSRGTQNTSGGRGSAGAGVEAGGAGGEGALNDTVRVAALVGTGRGAGAGGGGRGGSGADTYPAGRGSVAALFALGGQLGAFAAAGAAAPGLTAGGGGGSGGDNVPGWPGGSFGGGGGGGSAFLGTGKPGGAGAPGACLIINLF